MKVFFDTEFTGLHKNTTLISIGLVDENDRTFYFECNDFDRRSISDDEWIQKNVINKLKFKEFLFKSARMFFPETNQGFGNKTFLKQKLTEWLSDYDNVELISDVCHYDMVLFIDIFGTAFDLPKHVSPVCHDINQDIATFNKISEKQAFDLNREDFVISLRGNLPDFEQQEKHNALWDAMIIKQIYTSLEGV